LETNSRIAPNDWSDLAMAALSSQTGLPVKDEASFRSAAADVVPSELLPDTHEALAWLLSPSSTSSLPHLTSSPQHPIDLFATLLSHRLSYGPKERDLVVLHHEVVTSSSQAGITRDEIHSSSLEVYGGPEHSAMALCVGLPVAFAALHILDGGFREAGVHGPTDPGLYSHILARLDGAGLTMTHRVKPYSRSSGVEARLMEVWR